MKKIIFIAGATASGKSNLAIKLAKKNNGEIISADSRQIYKNIPIFSGAISKKEIKGVSHHLISFLEEENFFSVAEFQKKAEKKIYEIFKRNKIPIIIGGSSFYFSPLIYKNFLPNVKKNEKLREKLNKKNNEELFKILMKKDFKRAENIDKQNRSRLIRSIEIAEELGEVPIIKKEIKDNYEIFFAWFFLPIEKQRKKIAESVEKRIESGLIKEAELLQKKLLKILSPEKVEKRFIKLGLAYKHIYDFWEKKTNLNNFIEKIKIEEGKYAKRQNTYLKKFYSELPVKTKKKYFLEKDNFLEDFFNDIKKFIE